LWQPQSKQSRWADLKPPLTFTPNGRFTDGGAIYWLRHIRDFTMVFSFSDARQIKMAFESICGGESLL
jgi:hypothetical protein